VDLGADDWGRILKTPKPGWSNISLVQPLAETFGVPVGFDTDVNGAALAEYRWGAAKDCNVATYVTVGTGIGGGTTVNGQAIHGLRHPEVGHFLPRRHPADRDFAGTCPFHGDCLEGLASGPAIEKRWGVSLSHLPQDHIAHDVIAFYLGQLVVALQAVVSPRRIVFGGGVSNTPGLLQRVAQSAKDLGNGYFADVADMDGLVVAPGLGQQSGLLGALHLAEQAWQWASINT
jgi:fructokinase